ncbi:carboxypeptidase-like regulatory domain-containing protein [Bacteroidota bacterium]
MKKFILIIIVGTVVSFNLFAQNKIVEGYIIDKQTKEVLPGANIFSQSDWSVGSTTDDKGYFKLSISDHLKKDTVIVSFIGYKEEHLPVSMLFNKTFTIELEPFAQLLGESVVTARRIIAEEFTIKQIKQMEIYLNPASNADALLAVNAMAASTTTDESANISLRGSRPDETGIYLNDVPVYDAIRFGQLDGIGTFSIFNTDVIERMHVFAGNPPMEYGNTASGLVSLQTNNNIPTDPFNSLAISLANLGGLTSRKIGDKTAIIAFGNYQPSQMFTGLNQDAMSDLEDFSSTDFGLHVIHNFSSNLRLKVFNYSNMEGYKYKYRNPSYTGIFDMNKTRNYTIANFIKQNDKGEITINAGYSVSKESFKYSITDISIEKQDVYFSTSYQHFFDKLNIKTGVSVDYRENSTTGNKPAFDYAQNPNHPQFSFKSFDSYFLPEFFIYTKYNITDNLIFGTGARKNVKVNDQPNYLSYQANFNYKINDKHNFNLSGGHYNRLTMPNAEEFVITHYESNQLSLDYTFTANRYEIQTALFTKESDHKNKTDIVKGGEFYTKFDIRQIEFQFSFTAVDAQIENGTEKYPSNYDLDYFVRSVIKYSMKDNFEISAIYVFRQGSHYLPVESSLYDASLNAYSPVYMSWDESQRLPDYHKIDLLISKFWVVNPDLAIVFYANASNLLNTNNVREKNYNSTYSETFNELYSKRTVYFGVSVMF